MNVIWKRPDGYHGASPDDFIAIEVGNGDLRLWFHKKDFESYPFRVSGGWEEEKSSKKLNNLVNLLRDPPDLVTKKLKNMHSHSLLEVDRIKFFEDLTNWLKNLQKNLKGDSWEIDMMAQSIDATVSLLMKNKDQFLADT